MSPRSHRKVGKPKLAKGAKAPKAFTPKEIHEAFSSIAARFEHMENLLMGSRSPSINVLESSSLENARIGTVTTAPPREISAQQRLAQLCGRADGIAAHLGDLMNRLNPDGIDGASATSPPNAGSVHGLLDHLEGLVNTIGNRTEYLSARL